MRRPSGRRLHPNTPCTAAVAIAIDWEKQTVGLGEGSRFYPAGKLARGKIGQLAHRDGFENCSAFFRFFLRGPEEKFTGQPIEWRP